MGKILEKPPPSSLNALFLILMKCGKNVYFDNNTCIVQKGIFCHICLCLVKRKPACYIKLKQGFVVSIADRLAPGQTANAKVVW